MTRSKKTDKDGRLYEMSRFIVRCDICNDTIESISENDNVTCVCNNLMIRGGVEHERFIACTHDLVTDLSVWKLIN